MKKLKIRIFFAVLAVVILACGQSIGAVVQTSDPNQPASVTTGLIPGSDRTSPAPAGSVVLAD